MKWKYLTSSGAFAGSGDEARVQKIIISGTGTDTTVGTVSLETGGASGTTQWGCSIAGGRTVQLDLPYIKADYVTLANASATVRWTGQFGT